MLISRRDNNIILLITLDVLVAISIIIILVMSFIGYFSLQYGQRAVLDISNNWQKSPIVDILDAKGECQAEYRPFVNDQWGGTVEGCDCVGRYSYRIPTSYRNRLNREYCTYNMTLGGCTSVSPVNPVPYKTWKGVNLCAKKSQKTFNDYLTNNAPADKNCKNGFKQCGKMDSLGNLLCVENTQKCPINKIMVRPKSEEAPKDFNYQKIELGSNSNLYYTNEAINENILLDLKVSEGAVCIDPLEKNSKYKQYVLDRDYLNFPCSTKIGNILYDTRYVSLDSILKRDLFSQNGINPLLNYLPYFPYSSLDATSELYTRPFIGWKQNCINDPIYDPSIVNVLSEKIDGLSGLKLAIIILGFVILIYFIVHVIIKYNTINNILIFNLLEFAFSILAFVVLILSGFCLSKLGSYSFQFESFNCGDNITNEVFIEIGKRFENNEAYDRTILILSLFTTLAYYLYIGFEIILQLLQNCTRNKNNNYNNNNNNIINNEEIKKDLNYNSDFKTPNPIVNKENGDNVSYISYNLNPNLNNNPQLNNNNQNNINDYSQNAPAGPVVNNFQAYPSLGEINNNN